MGRRAHWAVLLAAASAACAGVAYVSRVLPAPVERQALALGGAPDQSRTSVVGDANIDRAWQGVWKRTPAAYSAVRGELGGYQALTGAQAGAAVAPAVAQGETILRGYSKVLGAPHSPRTRAAADPAAEEKRRLYDAFMLQGGTKAQLYDAAVHNKELKAYGNVLAFSDKLPPQAIDGPAGKAIKSSKDELSSYSSILDFSTPQPVFTKKEAVRSHNGVLSFPGSTRDARHIAAREKHARNLDPASVASEHASHSGILTFPGDEDDADRIAQREAAHKVLDESALKAERHAHQSILDFSGAPDEETRARDASPAKPRAAHTLQPQLISKELTSYDSILEFPGQRQLNALKDPQPESKELQGYSNILDFSGHAGTREQLRKTPPAVLSAGAEHKAARHTHRQDAAAATEHERASGAGGPTGTAGKAGKAGKPSLVSKVGNKRGGVQSKAGQSKGEEKTGAPTMLLDEALVQQTVAQEKRMEDKAILIEPPQEVKGSPISNKLAHLYREAKRLIAEEAKPAAAAKAGSPAKAAAPTAPVKAGVVHAAAERKDAGVAAVASGVETAVQRKVPQLEAKVGEGRRGLSRVAKTERRLSRDPELRRLQLQATRLRARLRAKQMERKKEEKHEMLEEDALSHVLSHKEKLLRLDETLEHKLSHKTTRGLKRADTSMTHMIQDDEARLRTLEAAQARRAAADARRKARQERMLHLQTAEQKSHELEREHALLLAKIHDLRRILPRSYADGIVTGAGNRLAHQAAAPALALQQAGTQELAQLDSVAPHVSELSSEAKVEYARKLARAEEVLHEARTMADGFLKNAQHTAVARTNVAKVNMDLEAIANVLKDRALHVVLDGKSSDEHLHRQSLHQLVDAAAAHADKILGKGTRGAEELEHVMQELRDSAEAHAYSPVATRARQQLLRSLLTQEQERKSRLRSAMTSLHRHVRGPRAPQRLLRKTAAALEDSGDYVEPLHARAVLLPKDGQAGRLASARNGEHAELEGENEWKRARKTVGDASLLSQRPDSPEVLSKEGKADEDKALKTDISALVDATQHKDVKQYDGMLKAAINKSEKKLASFEAAQDSEARQVWSGMASADKVFAETPRARPASAVRDAMRAATRIEHTLHLKFDKKGSIFESVAPPAKKAAHGKHYIPGLGRVHKDNGLISAIFKHHRVPVAKAEAMQAPKLHALSKRTHARLTDHAVFKRKGVVRRETLKQPSAWHMVDHDADNAMRDGSEVGKDVAEVTGSLFQGLTDDSRKRSGDAKANSLWRYI